MRMDNYNKMISWTGSQSGQDLTYSVFSQRNGTNWKILSTFDFNTTKSIEVLNVYPNTGTKVNFVQNIICLYKSQPTINITLPLSAILKVWVEGGYYVYNGINYSLESFGMNFDTQEEIINVTPISSSDFESMSVESMLN